MRAARGAALHPRDVHAAAGHWKASPRPATTVHCPHTEARDPCLVLLLFAHIPVIHSLWRKEDGTLTHNALGVRGILFTPEIIAMRTEEGRRVTELCSCIMTGQSFLEVSPSQARRQVLAGRDLGVSH